MEENIIFNEKKKLTNDIEKLNDEFFNQRIETKLSLRKKAMNDILYNRRILQNNSVNIDNKKVYKLKYDISNIKLIIDKSEVKFNINFDQNEGEKILSYASKYLKSENIDDIKNGIILTKMFINKNLNNNLSDYINFLFIYELFHIIDRIKDNKKIIFNILDIIISYSYINNDLNLATILLSPNSYKTFELCFNLQDFEIFHAIICVLINIIKDNQIGTCNLIRSNFLQNNIFHFFMNESIISQKNIEDKNNIIYHIIQDGITLFCHLMIVPIDNLDLVTKEEIKSSKKNVIKILLSYLNSNCFESYYKCIYSIAIIVEKDCELFEELEKYNFIENILLNKKFFDEKKTLFYLNKIIGNYLAFKKKVSDKILSEVVEFESNYLDICKDSSERKNIFWTLSNLIMLDKNSYEKIFEVKQLIPSIVDSLKNSHTFSEIKEIIYFFGILLSLGNLKHFFIIEENHLLKLILDIIKNVCENKVDILHMCFQIIEIYLEFGEITSKYHEGKNIIKKKFEKLGGKEILEKYINYQCGNFDNEIINIYKKFY